MNIDDVSILKSLNPIEVIHKDEVLEETWLQLAKIINEDKAHTLIEDVREKHGLPMNGFDIKKYEGKNFKDLGLNNYLGMGLTMPANYLSERLGLGSIMLDQMFLLMYFNAFLDVKFIQELPSFKIEFVAGRENISNKSWKYKHEVGALFFPFYANKQMVIDWVRKNWDDAIEKQIDMEIFENPLGKQTLKWTKIASELIHYRDRENKQFKEIATILSDKYGKEFGIVADEDWCRAIYEQYKKHLTLWKPPKSKQKST